MNNAERANSPLYPHKKGKYETMLEKNNIEIPVWHKFTLSIEEAALYFRIGENKLRKIVAENRDADFILWNGSRPQIKRSLFEKYIEKCSLI